MNPLYASFYLWSFIILLCCGYGLYYCIKYLITFLINCLKSRKQIKDIIKKRFSKEGRWRSKVNKVTFNYIGLKGSVSWKDMMFKKYYITHTPQEAVVAEFNS